MSNFSVNLTNLVENAYAENIAKYGEWGFYSFGDYTPDLTTEEIQKYSQIHTDRSIDEIKDSIRSVQRNNYETSYIGEYQTAVQRELEDKIVSDFKKLSGFFDVESGELVVEGSLSVSKVDFANDLVFFEGNVDVLASYCINALNGYGAFEYSTLTEFYDSYPCTDDASKLAYVEQHLHWLHKIEEIYGTVHDFFRLNTKHIDYYGGMGSYDYTDKDIADHIADNY